MHDLNLLIILHQLWVSCPTRGGCKEKTCLFETHVPDWKLSTNIMRTNILRWGFHNLISPIGFHPKMSHVPRVSWLISYLLCLWQDNVKSIEIFFVLNADMDTTKCRERKVDKKIAGGFVDTATGRLALTRAHHYNISEVNMPNSVIYLDWTSLYKWYVVRCGSMNIYQEDMFKRDWIMCSKYTA